MGAPPSPICGTLSSIAISTYKRCGRGAKIILPCLARVFLLTTVLYVDDMDILHWADSPYVEDEELIECIQRDVKVWGETVQSTGGIIKVIECSLFLLAYKWPHGYACLKTLNNLCIL